MRISWPIVPLALLVGCSSGSETLQPGQWEITTDIIEAEYPGISEAETRQLLDNDETQSRCLSPEEAAEPGPELFLLFEAADGCEFERQATAGGVVDIRAQCRNPDGAGHADITVDGTYDATTLDSELTIEGRDDEDREIRMVATMRWTRTGECET